MTTDKPIHTSEFTDSLRGDAERHLGISAAAASNGSENSKDTSSTALDCLRDSVGIFYDEFIANLQGNETTVNHDETARQLNLLRDTTLPNLIADAESLDASSLFDRVDVITRVAINLHGVAFVRDGVLTGLQAKLTALRDEADRVVNTIDLQCVIAGDAVDGISKIISDDLRALDVLVQNAIDIDSRALWSDVIGAANDIGFKLQRSGNADLTTFVAAVDGALLLAGSSQEAVDNLLSVLIDVRQSLSREIT